MHASSYGTSQAGSFSSLLGSSDREPDEHKHKGWLLMMEHISYEDCTAKAKFKVIIIF